MTQESDLETSRRVNIAENSLLKKMMGLVRVAVLSSYVLYSISRVPGSLRQQLLPKSLNLKKKCVTWRYIHVYTWDTRVVHVLVLHRNPMQSCKRRSRNRRRRSLFFSSSHHVNSPQLLRLHLTALCLTCVDGSLSSALTVQTHHRCSVDDIQIQYIGKQSPTHTVH